MQPAFTVVIAYWVYDALLPTYLLYMLCVPGHVISIGYLGLGLN